MANGNDDPRVYQALALPAQALDHGGTEILRAGIIDDELYVTALPAFRDPGKWGEVLAEVAKRVGAIYAAEGLDLEDATIQVAEAFAAEMGAKPVSAARSKPQAKPRAKTRTKKTAAKKSAAKRKKR
jgi:hypothetical protein